jgi:hypothetical protein
MRQAKRIAAPGRSAMLVVGQAECQLAEYLHLHPTPYLQLTAASPM